jgi:hypothetical protein
MNLQTPFAGNRRRCGSVYILVLITGFLVAAMALASLNLDRLQGQMASDNNDFVEARSYARAGVEIGMLMIRNDPYWRTDLGNGAWVTNKPIGAGTFSLSAIDPIDGDVTNGNNDPIILTSTGAKGRAKYLESVRLEVGPPVGSCFEVSMLAGQNLQMNSGTLTGNQTVAALGNVTVNGGSLINANAEASGNIQGTGYTKATASGVAARTMPNPATCFNYYLTNGTTINATTDLPLARNLQFLDNTSFETDTSSWYAVGGSTLSISASRAYAGTHSLLVNRKLSSDSVAQNLDPVSLSRLAAASGNQFTLVMPIYSATACSATATLTLTIAGSSTQTYSTNQQNVNAGQWSIVQGNLVPSFSGSVTQATISIAISGTGSFYMDGVSLTDQSYPNNIYVIDHALLTPTSNPFGSGVTNAQGIYVINCANNNVQISNSRIVGTLVFVNPGPNVGVYGPVIWEPAVYNYPALLAQFAGGGQITIQPSSVALSEATLGFNMNPPGTPYPYIGGSTNSTMTDSYPSQINGLIYSSQNLSFAGSPTLYGVVLAANQISFGGTLLNISYGNVYLNNPPPGFTGGTITMKEVPGTWQRVVH